MTGRAEPLTGTTPVLFRLGYTDHPDYSEIIGELLEQGFESGATQEYRTTEGSATAQGTAEAIELGSPEQAADNMASQIRDRRGVTFFKPLQGTTPRIPGSIELRSPGAKATNSGAAIFFTDGPFSYLVAEGRFYDRRALPRVRRVATELFRRVRGRPACD